MQSRGSLVSRIERGCLPAAAILQIDRNFRHGANRKKSRNLLVPGNLLKSSTQSHRNTVTAQMSHIEKCGGRTAPFLTRDNRSFAACEPAISSVRKFACHFLGWYDKGRYLLL